MDFFCRGRIERKEKRGRRLDFWVVTKILKNLVAQCTSIDRNLI
jgi:exonuclease III